MQHLRLRQWESTQMGMRIHWDTKNFWRRFRGWAEKGEWQASEDSANVAACKVGTKIKWAPSPALGDDNDNCIFTWPITKLQVRCSFAEVLDASNVESKCSFWSKAEALSRNYLFKPQKQTLGFLCVLHVCCSTYCWIKWLLITQREMSGDLWSHWSLMGTASFSILSLWELNS